MDVASSFWTKVKELAASRKIISIDKVKNEIYNYEDELKQWCIVNLPSDFFKSTDGLTNEYRIITSWAIARNNQYNQAAINEFLQADEADAWLVAFALNHRIPIVTQEKSAPNSKTKIKIPDVCLAFDIQNINTIEMFRQLEEKF